MLSLANPLLDIDVYKNEHDRMNPKGVTRVSSNWVFRKSRLPGVDRVTFFGLRNYLASLEMKWGLFFSDQRIAGEMIHDYGRALGAMTDSVPEVQRFARLFKYGRLPLTVAAVKEGESLPIGAPGFTVESTNPGFSWLPQYIESGFSNGFWKAPTAATISVERTRKDRIALDVSGGPHAILPFLNHDFSYRGTSGSEDAIMVGLGHLVGADGSDTVPASARAYELYNRSLVGKSIAASEHSVMCIDGEDLEFETFKRILELYPDRPLALVGDTYNLWRVISVYLPRLGDLLTKRTVPLVIRPDSGEPVKILLGNDAETDPVARRGVVPFLMDQFGRRLTSKDYALLPPFIGTIYGDAMNDERCDELNETALSLKICPSTVIRGRGSYTYEYLTRDTLGQAFKATDATVSGEVRALFKDPITDPGKKSLKGRVGVRRDPDTGLITGALDQLAPDADNGFTWYPMIDGVYQPFEDTMTDVRNRTGVW